MGKLDGKMLFWNKLRNWFMPKGTTGIKRKKCKKCNGYGILLFSSEPDQHHLEEGYPIKSDLYYHRIMDALMSDGWTYPKDHTHVCGECNGAGK